MGRLSNRAAEVAALSAMVILGGCAATATVAESDAEVGTSGHVISAKAAAPGALGVGDTAPKFNLASATGARETLDGLLEDGPVVLTFYRGDWCPLCKRALSGLQEAHADIEATGAQIVAISPQTVEYSAKSKAGWGLDYVVLSDPGNGVASDFGVAFQLPDNLLNTYKNSYNIDLAKFNDGAESSLPLATLFVIDQDREIRYAFVTDDYRKRANPDDVIEALRGL